MAAIGALHRLLGRHTARLVHAALVARVEFEGVAVHRLAAVLRRAQLWPRAFALAVAAVDRARRLVGLARDAAFAPRCPISHGAIHCAALLTGHRELRDGTGFAAILSRRNDGSCLNHFPDGRFSRGVARRNTRVVLPFHVHNTVDGARLLIARLLVHGISTVDDGTWTCHVDAWVVARATSFANASAALFGAARPFGPVMPGSRWQRRVSARFDLAFGGLGFLVAVTVVTLVELRWHALSRLVTDTILRNAHTWTVLGVAQLRGAVGAVTRLSVGAATNGALNASFGTRSTFTRLGAGGPARPFFPFAIAVNGSLAHGNALHTFLFHTFVTLNAIQITFAFIGCDAFLIDDVFHHANRTEATTIATLTFDALVGARYIRTRQWTRDILAVSVNFVIFTISRRGRCIGDAGIAAGRDAEGCGGRGCSC